MDLAQKKSHTSKNGKDLVGGFTLIEIIVSLALFAVVAVVAIGAFLKIIDSNRRAQAIETAINDTSFALESMVRDLRVGADYQCLSTGAIPPSTITSPSIQTCGLNMGKQTVAFNSSQTAPKTGGGTCNLVHVYGWSGNTSQGYILQKAEQVSCAQAYGSGGYVFSPLTSTSSDLTIQTFGLQVDGTSGIIQPKVFILLGGYSGLSAQDRTTFVVQTTASQRLMQ